MYCSVKQPFKKISREGITFYSHKKMNFHMKIIIINMENGKMFFFSVCKTNTQFLIKYFFPYWKYYIFVFLLPACLFSVIKFLLFVYAHEYFSHKLFKDTRLNVCQVFTFPTIFYHFHFLWKKKYFFLRILLSK